MIQGAEMSAPSNQDLPCNFLEFVQQRRQLDEAAALELIAGWLESHEPGPVAKAMLHAQQRPAPPRRQAAEREQFVDRAAARTKKRTRRATAFQSAHRAVAAVMLAAATAVSGGCSRAEQPRSATAASVSPQQAIVDRSAAAIERLRSGSAGAELDRFLQRARGIMIFPRLVKASLIVGGEGGNGVLLARGADGSWSNPAFYSLAAPSVGLQIGYLEATVVLFIMEQKTLETALHSDVTLGSSSSVALGTLSEHRSEGEVYSKPIYQLLEARGAFVGASLDGYVISARNKHNQAYYGGPVTPRGILIERLQHQPGAARLLRALEPRDAAPQQASR